MQFIQKYGKGDIYKQNGVYILRIGNKNYTGANITECINAISKTYKTPKSKKPRVVKATKKDSPKSS